MRKYEIDFILAYGHEVHHQGRAFCVLRKKDIPQNYPKNGIEVEKLRGTVLVFDRYGDILGIHKNGSPRKFIYRREFKYRQGKRVNSDKATQLRLRDFRTEVAYNQI